MFERFVPAFLAAVFIILSAGGSLFALDKKDSLSLSHYIMAFYFDGLGLLDEAAKEYEESIRLDQGQGKIIEKIKKFE